MDSQDFDFEFYSDVPDPENAMRNAAEKQIRVLGKGHRDMTGAAVAIESIAHGVTPHEFRARVVVYIRPTDVVAVEKDATPEAALRNSLKAVERRVREQREKLGKPWQRAGIG